MKIGIIGAGRVGAALQTGWIRAGHEVQIASRSTSISPSKLSAWADVLAVAVPFSAVADVAASLPSGISKILIDCTNPAGQAVKGAASGGERLQGLLPQAQVVKSLNQVGAEIMADTDGFAHPPVQFMAGDSVQAKEIVSTLLTDLGFEALDAGDLTKAAMLEAFALLWINQAIRQGKGRDWAFSALPRKSVA